ncbi:glycosyltransferase [Limosilactobacillus panis]|uniref:Glycosyltransferase n=1 Tax=Limosilactobacillus panis TaxID=47493 RepID=A0ABT7VN46_9LACO|nr:glycosyltransferase [Limosilactobacillus panis]MDM8334172.1 glycosyltransferase [Limosilactobacillus panis]
MTEKRTLFSIITIVNKEDVYQGFKKSLEAQDGVNYELIKVNNDHNQFASARAAYNSAMKKAHGDYLIFSHPDMRFLDKYSLRDALEQVTQLHNLGVAGVSGCPSEVHHHHSTLVTAIVHDNPPHHFGTLIDKTTAVQTVDECFFVMKRSFSEEHPFSDIKGWHMYAVEQCLVALLNGRKNYVVPARMWHYSTGFSENWQYVKTGQEIAKRYGKDFPTISTTITTWFTRNKLGLLVIPPIKLIKHQLWRKVGLSN